MFGAWQAGVWRAIGARTQIDFVIGASVGALNGWAIASGICGDELVAEWQKRETADLIQPQFPSPWLFRTAPLHEAAQKLFDRYRPKLPFAATLVEVPKFKLRLVRAEEMTWRHLAATCTIPAGFPPQKLDGRWYVDGGLLGALPLWAAKEFGATRVIALDALPAMPSRVLRTGARMLRRMRKVPRSPQSIDLRVLRPTVELGNVRDAVYWNPENARRWIEQGERDAKLLITI